MLEGESDPKETKGGRRQRGASETTDGYRGTRAQCDRDRNTFAKNDSAPEFNLPTAITKN